MHECMDVAHSIGVQHMVLSLICLQESFFNVLVIFFVLKLGVYRGVRSPCSEFIDF